MEDQNRSNISKTPKILAWLLKGSFRIHNSGYVLELAPVAGPATDQSRQARVVGEKHEAASRVVVIANSRRVAPRFDQVAGLSALYVGVII